MTTVSPPPTTADRDEPRGGTVFDAPADETVPDADGEGGGRLPAALRNLTWRFWLFTPVLVVLALAVPILTWKGFHILRTEDTGQTIDVETDPTAPGYEALVTPTPTAMILDVGAQGTLTGATLLTRPTQDQGGDVVFFPPGTLLDVPLPDGTTVQQTMAEIEAGGGPPALEQRVETLLGAGIGEMIVVNEGEWAQLVAPVAPLTVTNPSSVTSTDAAGVEHSFPAGEIELAAQDVDAYLEALGPGETDLVRITREEAFLKAWLRALDEAGDEAIPGEGDTGIGAFVRGLAGGPRQFSVLPVDPVPIPGYSIIDSNIFQPRTLEIVVRVPELIPFPTGVGRMRTRLVDGAGGDPTLLATTARTLVQAGAEITVVANDEQFDEEETTVTFFKPEDRPEAQRLLDALGVGRLVRDTGINDTIDVVVVLGQDFADAAGGDEDGSSGTTVPPIPQGGGDTGTGIPGGITPGAPGGDPAG